MGWENGYYYRKQRTGGKVCSVYVGGGLLGELAALEDEVTQAERRAMAEARQRARSASEAVDAEYKTLRSLVSAVLLTGGYHQHKREWRRCRDG